MHPGLRPRPETESCRRHVSSQACLQRTSLARRRLWTVPTAWGPDPGGLGHGRQDPHPAVRHRRGRHRGRARGVGVTRHVVDDAVRAGDLVRTDGRRGSAGRGTAFHAPVPEAWLRPWGPLLAVDPPLACLQVADAFGIEAGLVSADAVLRCGRQPPSRRRGSAVGTKTASRPGWTSSSAASGRSSSSTGSRRTGRRTTFGRRRSARTGCAPSATRSSGSPGPTWPDRPRCTRGSSRPSPVPPASLR